MERIIENFTPAVYTNLVRTHVQDGQKAYQGIGGLYVAAMSSKDRMTERRYQPRAPIWAAASRAISWRRLLRLPVRVLVIVPGRARGKFLVGGVEGIDHDPVLARPDTGVPGTQPLVFRPRDVEFEARCPFTPRHLTLHGSCWEHAPIPVAPGARTATDDAVTAR